MVAVGGSAQAQLFSSLQVTVSRAVLSVRQSRYLNREAVPIFRDHYRVFHVVFQSIPFCGCGCLDQLGV